MHYGYGAEEKKEDDLREAEELRIKEDLKRKKVEEDFEEKVNFATILHDKYYAKKEAYYKAYHNYIKKITDIKNQKIKYNETEVNTLNGELDKLPKFYPNSEYNFTSSIIVSHNARMKCLLGKLDTNSNFMFQKGAVLKFSINTNVTVELLHDGYSDPTDKYTSYYTNKQGGGWNPFRSNPNIRIFNTIDATLTDFNIPVLNSKYIFYILRNGANIQEIQNSFTIINTDITSHEFVDYKINSSVVITTKIKDMYDYLKSINNIDENGNVIDPLIKLKTNEIENKGLTNLSDATAKITHIYFKKNHTEIEKHFKTKMIEIIYTEYSKLKLEDDNLKYNLKEGDKLNEDLDKLANIKNKYNSFKLLSSRNVNDLLDKLNAIINPITIFVSDLDRSRTTAKIIKREEAQHQKIIEFVNSNPKRKMSKLIVLPCSHEVASHANGNCDSSFLSKSSSSENYPTCNQNTLKLNVCDKDLTDWKSLYFPFYADQMRSENDNFYGMMFGKKVIRKKCRDTNMILTALFQFEKKKIGGKSRKKSNPTKKTKKRRSKKNKTLIYEM